MQLKCATVLEGLANGNVSVKFGSRTVAIASVAVFLIATTVIAPTSGASGTGSISGTVTNAQTTAGISGVCIVASGNSSPYIFNATTASDGTYTISGLSNGPYEVKVDPTCNGEFASSLDILVLSTVTISSGSALTGVNAALVPGGSASGTVVGSESDTGVPQVCVDFVSTTDRVDTVTSVTGANGNFTISNLSAGSYSFVIDPSCPGAPSSIYAMQTWPETVSVTSGQTLTNLNVTLEIGATITGTVTSATTHAPVTGAGIGVTATTGVFKNDGVAYGYTTDDGTYAITDLAPGTYLVDFDETVNGGPTSAGAVGPYAAEQLPNPLTVQAGVTSSNENFVLYAKTVTVPFASKAYTLSNAQKRVLLADARTIEKSSLVVVTGYALNNRSLAKKRAETAAAYMKSKEGIVSNVKVIANVATNQVVIVNDGDSLDPS